MRHIILIFCLTLIPFFPSLSPGGDLKNQGMYIEPVTGMEFVLLPPGSFTMGYDNDKDARPAHEVHVPSFYMGKYEVTFAQYDRFCVETGRPLPGDEGWGRVYRPAIHVSWQDAMAFAGWLSEKTGKIFRLPSEAEWEYAARAGTSTHFHWGDALGRSNANCKGCGTPWDDGKTAAVGSFRPNNFGLFDMAGNVYEWTLDFKHPDYQGAPTDGSAWVESKDYRWARLRVTRGGSWGQDPMEIRPYARCWDGMNDRTREIGFRLVMEP